MDDLPTKFEKVKNEEHFFLQWCEQLNYTKQRIGSYGLTVFRDIHS